MAESKKFLSWLVAPFDMPGLLMTVPVITWYFYGVSSIPGLTLLCSFCGPWAGDRCRLKGWWPYLVPPIYMAIGILIGLAVFQASTLGYIVSFVDFVLAGIVSGYVFALLDWAIVLCIGRQEKADPNEVVPPPENNCQELE